MPAAGNLMVRPIIGGIQISTSTLVGTLGLVYQEGYFATAGHAVGAADSLVGQPNQASNIGRVEANFLSDGADIALVKVLKGVLATQNMVWVAVNATLAVTFETEQRPEEGELYGGPRNQDKFSTTFKVDFAPFNIVG